MKTNPVQKRDTTVVFVRYDRAEVCNFAVLTLRTTLQTDTEVKAALKAAVAHWINRTEAGRKLWNYASGDVNIGDLAGYSAFDDAELLTAMSDRGVDFGSCFVGGSEDTAPYDEVLVNEQDIEEDECAGRLAE